MGNLSGVASACLLYKTKCALTWCVVHNIVVSELMGETPFIRRALLRKWSYSEHEVLAGWCSTDSALSIQLKRCWTSFGTGSLRKWMLRMLLGTFFITISSMKVIRGTSQVLGTQDDRIRSCICA